MYNLDTNLAATAAASNAALNGLLAVETGATPRTPEILNSLMAMTNPLDGYTFGDDAPKPKQNQNPHHSQALFASASSDSNSSSCSQVESPTNGPNSVQQTCSQLIKAGLKLTIEQKRKHQNDNDDILDLDKCKRIKRNECSESEEDKVNNSGWFSNYIEPTTYTGKSGGISRKSDHWGEVENDDFQHSSMRKLTPEDEERRRRRRERNKIAATKCRLKKRERTANLVSESEILEKQNVDLKAQIQVLRNEEVNLSAMLQAHKPICQKNIPKVTRDAIYMIPSASTNNNNNRSNIMNNHNNNNHSYNNRDGFMDIYNRPNSGDVTFTRPITFGKPPPTIIVESPTTTTDTNFQTHLTNLDNITTTTASHQVYQLNNYTNQQCHAYTGQNYDNGCLA